MDTATYLLKIAYFYFPSLIRRPRSLFPLEFQGEVNHKGSRIMGLLCGESCMSTAIQWTEVLESCTPRVHYALSQLDCPAPYTCLTSVTRPSRGQRS